MSRRARSFRRICRAWDRLPLEERLPIREPPRDLAPERLVIDPRGHLGQVIEGPERPPDLLPLAPSHLERLPQQPPRGPGGQIPFKLLAIWLASWAARASSSRRRSWAAIWPARHAGAVPSTTWRTRAGVSTSAASASRTSRFAAAWGTVRRFAQTCAPRERWQ
ncbi:MAG: hypothetical protein L0027_06795 [Candidatus Rokubacteria bacterium]|nr:hypothetical protein [Candidatus Rokubacteria bacterium]